MPQNQLSGNLLGGIRAEIDSEMLEKAFIKTHDFEALVNTRDFNFVVGRRGTGKSALYLKVTEYLKKKNLAHCVRTFSFQHIPSFRGYNWDSQVQA